MSTVDFSLSDTSSTGSVHPAERFLLNFFGVSFAVLAIYVSIATTPSELQQFHLFPAFLARLSDKLPYSVFLMFFVPILTGLLVAIYWEWKKLSPERMKKYQFWTTAIIRYYLAYVFLSYGISKIFKGQFNSFLSVLDMPVSQLSGMQLAWRFFGYSYAYTLFIASSQIISSILFFFRRTATLGATILLPVISNIVFVNFSHHIPVKLMSSIYLTMTLFLLAQDHRRLKALLWDNKPYGKPAFATIRISKPLKAARYILIFVMFALSIAENHAAYVKFEKTTTPLYGSWDVQEFKVNGETPPASDSSVWKKVYFESDMFVSIRRATSGASIYQQSFDSDKRTISFNTYGSETPFFEGSYQLEGNDNLTIDGTGDKVPIHAVLTRTKTTKPPI